MPSVARTFGPALRGVRENARAGLVLQTFAVLIVVAYFYSPTVRGGLAVVGAWRVTFGLGFSVVSTLLAGAVVPYLVLLASGRLARDRRLPEALFQLVFWLWRAIEVDYLYRLQAALFGSEASPSVVAAKVAFDQFVYNPFWVVPLQTFLFLWKGEGFSLSNVRAALGRRSFFERYVVGLVTSFAVWLPAVSAIYSMPTALQLPLCNIVLCFWCLLLSFVSSDETDERPAVVAVG